MTRGIVVTITTLFSASVLLCSCMSFEDANEQSSEHNRSVAAEFVSLVLEKSRKNELLDIDKFLADNSLTHHDFYQQVLRELVCSENQIAPISTVRYRFQKCLSGGHFGRLRNFTRSLCLEYLSGLHGPFQQTPGVEFVEMCDSLYVLNTEPSNMRKKYLVSQYLVGQDKSKFRAAALYLTDKKVMLGIDESILRESPFLQIITEDDCIYIERHDSAMFRVILDHDHYLTATELDR
jgi:hypothetical protein